jgi:SAM-dependent methyltransferase
MTGIYDDIYANCPAYNEEPRPGYYVPCIDFCRRMGGLILDVGCGQGRWMRRLMADEINVYGIEPSQVCCEKYLKDLPHECSDILTFAPKGKYSGVICMGVLEHIEGCDLDANLVKLSTLSGCALFGIANHLSILRGYNLHVIMQPKDWWKNRLAKFYDTIEEKYDIGEFFMFELSQPLSPGGSRS